MNSPLTPKLSTSYPSSRQARSLLAMLFLAYTLSFVDRQIMSLLVAPIREDLGITDFQFSLLHGLAFALFFALLGLPIGRLADTRSRRGIIAIGIAIWSAMTALCGLAQNFTQLFLSRMGVGVGEASLMPSAYSMLSDAFPPEKLTRAVAIFSTGGTLGTGLAFVVGGLVIEAIADVDTVSLFGLVELKSWQTAFLVVGLPGLLVSALMMTVIEPRRQGLLRDSDDKPMELPVRAVLRYLLRYRASYGALFFVTALMTALNAGFIMWYPTFLMRIHGFSISEAGFSFGLMFMIFGTLGVLAGGWLAGVLNRRGYHDANMRVIVIAASLALLPYLLGPLMPDATTAMALMALAITATQMIAAVCIAAIQLVTPNQMRGQASSVFILVINLIGFGLGPSLIAFFTDYVFGDDLALPWSMSATALLVIPASIVLYWRSLDAYGKHLLEARQWH